MTMDPLLFVAVILVLIFVPELIAEHLGPIDLPGAVVVVLGCIFVVALIFR